jgi:hypothetical protein
MRARVRDCCGGLPGTTNCLLRARVSASFPRLALPGATSTGDPVGGGSGRGWSWNRPRRWMSARMRWWPPIRVPDAAGVGRGRGRRHPGGPHLPEVHLQPGDPGGLAAGRGRHPGGDGGHRPAAGSRSGRCWKSAGWSCCWSTPATSSSCPAARPMSVMPPGWVSCWSVGCCAAASCPRRRSASCGI